MKSKSGDGIAIGPAVHCLRVLERDLVSAIAIDEDLKEKPLFHRSLYLGIIYAMSVGLVDPSGLLCQLNRQHDMGLTEEEIHYHISRVKSDYGKFVPIMTAIVGLKLSDFASLGASIYEAVNCLGDWIESELF